MKPFSELLLATLMATTLVGCNVLTSQRVDLQPTMKPNNASSHYFLPKARVRFEASRTAPSTLQNQKSTSMDKTTSDTKTGTQAGTTTNTEKSEQIIADKTTNPEGLCTLQLKEVFYEPDRDYLYRIDHSRNWFAADKIKVITTPTGLLSKVDISAEDKSPEFAQKLGELAKEAAKAAAAMAKAAPTTKPFVYSFAIDPTDQSEVQEANAALKKVQCNLQIEVKEPQPPVPNHSPAVTARVSANAIYYRPALPYRVNILGSDEQPTIIQNTVNLPNKAPVLALNLDRVAFGKYTHVIQFDNGMLKEVEFEVPSSAIGFMSIPIEIAKAIASIPGEILKLKVDLTSADKKLLDEQAGLAKSQKELLEKQEELRQYLDELQKAKAKDITEKAQ